VSLRFFPLVKIALAACVVCVKVNSALFVSHTPLTCKEDGNMTKAVDRKIPGQQFSL
jgi:hypothetical protein